MKQRLVGAIVLVALAVIFLPMLLDGSGRPEQVDVRMDIPEEPEAPASRLDEEPAPEPAATGAADGADDGDVATGQSAGSADAAGPEGSPETRDGAAEEARAKAEGGDDGADAAATAGDAPTAWAVQVGSFAKRTNALVLRDRLRQQDFDAFVEEADSDGQTVWRVRVGPVPTRDRAESLKTRIEGQRGSGALVTSYP